METSRPTNAEKHGEEEMARSSKIDHLVKETQGVIVYQEQVNADREELSAIRSASRSSGAAPWARNPREMTSSASASSPVRSSAGSASAGDFILISGKFATTLKQVACPAYRSSPTDAYLKAHYPG